MSLSLWLFRLGELIVVHRSVTSLELLLTDLLWRLVLAHVRHLLVLKVIIRHSLGCVLNTLVLMELLIVRLVESNRVTASVVSAVIEVAAVILTLIVVRLLLVVIVIR